MDPADIELVVRTAGELAPTERSAFIDMVVEGDEVVGAGLLTNIANAKVLVLLRRSDEFVGCAALKRPQASYRAKIIKKSGAALDEGIFPFELGYIFIRKAARGLRQSLRLVDAALSHADRAAVFATVRADNIPMHRTLAKAQFASAATYRGRNNRPITLLLRPASTS